MRGLADADCLHDVELLAEDRGEGVQVGLEDVRVQAGRRLGGGRRRDARGGPHAVASVTYAPAGIRVLDNGQFV